MIKSPPHGYSNCYNINKTNLINKCAYCSYTTVVNVICKKEYLREFCSAWVSHINGLGSDLYHDIDSGCRFGANQHVLSETGMCKVSSVQSRKVEATMHKGCGEINTVFNS